MAADEIISNQPVKTDSTDANYGRRLTPLTLTLILSWPKSLNPTLLIELSDSGGVLGPCLGILKWPKTLNPIP